MQRMVTVVVGTLVSYSLQGQVRCPAEPASAETRVVVRDQAEIRSGPGEQFYVTGHLARGTDVQVYHEGPESWVAIRPPAGSFSWIPADAIDTSSSSSVATVTKSGIRTRVGSAVGNDRQVAYITLKQGEKVRLLDSEAMADHESNRDWRRIAPPSGEFRWIRLEDVSPSGTDIATRDEGTASGYELLAESPSARSSPSAPDANSDGNDTPDEAGDVVRAQWSYDLAPRTYKDRESMRQREMEKSAADFSQTIIEIRRAVQSMIQNDAAIASDDANRGAAESDQPDSGIRLAAAEDLGLPSSPPEPAPSAIEPGRIATESLEPATDERDPLVVANELTRVAKDLTFMASRPYTEWELNSLRNRTRAIIDASETSALREQGQQLLARIAQFEDLQRRYRRWDRNFVARTPSGTSVGLARAGGNSGSNAWGDSAPPTNVTQYDGFGWLRPVLTQSPNTPRYVLVDNHGNILQFVSPSPGLNLNGYENKQVGVYGQRGFLPSMKQPHLVAERIVTIDRLR